MRIPLIDHKCIPCEGGTPPLKGEKLKELLTQLNKEARGWVVKNSKYLEKRFEFPDFQTALVFVNKIGIVAGMEGHHPNIEFGWGFVKVTLWTHSINGLSENDFFLAAKIEALK